MIDDETSQCADEHPASDKPEQIKQPEHPERRRSGHDRGSAESSSSGWKKTTFPPLTIIPPERTLLAGRPDLSPKNSNGLDTSSSR